MELFSVEEAKKQEDTTLQGCVSSQRLRVQVNTREPVNIVILEVVLIRTTMVLIRMLIRDVQCVKEKVGWITNRKRNVTSVMEEVL